MDNYQLYKYRMNQKKNNSNVETNENEEKISSKDLNWWEQFGAGYERIRDNLIRGALDLGEGIVDTGAGILSYGSKVFGNPEAEAELEKFIKTDYTNQIMNSDFGKVVGNVTGDFLFGDEAKKLAMSDERFLPEIAGVSLDDIAIGVGNALATGGLALIPGVGQAAVFSGFTGTGIEEALNEGSDIDNALKYGILSGTTEMVTEKVMGGVLSKLGLGLGKAFGTGASKSISNTFAKGTASGIAKNIGKNFLEEGLEEVVSDLANPIWQMMTYKSEAEGDFFEKYGKIFEENGGVQNLIESFIAGGITGGIFEGVSTIKGINYYGSADKYSLDIEARKINEINEKMKKALEEGNESRYNALDSQKQTIIRQSVSKFESLLNDINNNLNENVDNLSNKDKKRLERSEKLAIDYGIEANRDLGLEVAQKLLGDNIILERGSDGQTKSEVNISDAVVKFANNQMTFNELLKSILHEGVHLADGTTGEVVEKIIDGMSEKEYSDKWEWAEKYYKDEVLNSKMLKDYMENNPGISKEEAYEKVKKKYFDEEIASEYFAEMFKNPKDFIKSLKGYNAKGLSKLKEKIRQFFRRKSKPSNYNEIMEAFDKGIEKANLRGEETRRKITENEQINQEENETRYRATEVENEEVAVEDKPLPDTLKKNFIKRISKFPSGDGYKELVDRINNATESQFNDVRKEVVNYERQNDPAKILEAENLKKQEEEKQKIQKSKEDADVVINKVKEILDFSKLPNEITINVLADGSEVSKKYTLDGIKTYYEALVRAIESSVEISNLDRLNENLNKLDNLYESLNESVIDEEIIEEVETETETLVEEKSVEETTEKVEETPVEEKTLKDKISEITKKYNALNKIKFDDKNTIYDIKHDIQKRSYKKLKTVQEKKALIENSIRTIKKTLEGYNKELIEIGLSVEEAKAYTNSLKDRLIGEKEEGGTSLRQLYYDISKLENELASKEIDGNSVKENAVVSEIEPNNIEVSSDEKTKIENVSDHVSRTMVRKHLYADFSTDTDARVYAQQRGVELLQILTDELNKGLWGTKKYAPRLFFKNGKEFVINNIHMILNKFSNYQYAKSGAEAFDYSNLTKQEQIDLITKEIMSGVQILSTEFTIDDNGNPITDGKEVYNYITESDRAYSIISEFLANQLDNIISNKGDVPKVVKLIENETKKLREELNNSSNLLSKKELQAKAYEETINELKNEIELINNELLNVKGETDVDLENVNKLSESINDKKSKLEKINEKLKTRLSNITEENSTLKKTLNESLKNATRLSKRIEKLQNKIIELKEKLDTQIIKNKELKEVADNTARQVKKLKKIETKYADEIIFEKSKLERGRELPKNMVEVLTEIGKTINPEFELKSSISIKISDLLAKNNNEEAFDLMLNSILDSDFEADDSFITYDEYANMLNVDEASEFYTAVDSMKEWFNNFIKTGKITNVEKLYRKIERITNAYLNVKEKYNKKREEFAMYRSARGSVTTIRRVEKTFKKIKSESRLGGIDTNLVDWLIDFYDKIKPLKVNNIKNGEYKPIINELFGKYNLLSLNEDLKIDKSVLDLANQISFGEFNNKNIRAFSKLLNQMNRYIKEITGKAIYTIDGVSKTRSEWANEVYDNLNETVGSGKIKWNGFLNTFIDPRVVFKSLSGYDESSPFYKLYKMLNNGEIDYQKNMIYLGKNIKEFYKDKDNKKFIKELRSKKTISIGGYNATVSQFLSLYKLLQRKQSVDHLLNSIGGINLNGEIIRGFTEESIEQLRNDIIDYFDLNNENSIYKKYIDLVTDFFEKAKKLKVDTDIVLRGYTNVEEGEYFPIRITDEDLYTNYEKNELFMRSLAETDYSFNKDVASSTKSILVGNIDEIMDRHMRQVSTYSSYSIPIHYFNKIFNYRFTMTGEGSKGSLNSIDSLMSNKASGFKKYMTELIQDIQGLNTYKRTDENIFNKIFGFARGNFAKFQLGANLKVIFTQVSALGNALKYVKFKYIVRGINSKINIDSGKYSLPTIGVYRNMSNTISSAQMQKENYGSIWTSGIEKADQMCIRIIWKSCLLQNGMDVEKATEMFNKTVQETQPNYSALQRSAIMRSKNEIVKSITMFGNQPSKNFSNFIEVVSSISYKLKNGIPVSKADLNYAKKTVIESIIWGSTIYSIMSVIFNHLTNNDWDDEPEEYVQEMLERFANDSLIGNIPILGNAFDIKFKNGFGLDFQNFDLDNTFGGINNLVNLFNGNLSIKETVDTIGQILGIPSANVYKYISGLASYLAPELTTQIDLLYKGIDLTTTQAVKNTKSHKTKNYYMAYSTNTAMLSNEAMNELYRLYQKDDDVILKSIPNYLTIDGEQIKVSRSEFKKYYNKISSTLDNVISNYAYKKLPDEQKIAVMKFIISKYHSYSKKQFNNNDLNDIENLISSDYKNLAIDLMYLAQIKSMDDKKEIQSFINKLPLRASQKYLLYLLSGNSINDNQSDIVISYLKSKGVSSKIINNMFDM